VASAVDIKIGADTSKAQREIKQLGGVFGRLDRQSKRLGAAMSSPFMLAAAGAAAAGTAVIGLSAALVKNATAVAAMGDEFAKTARVLGVTNAETQQLSFLAGRARVDFSKLNAGLKRLQRNMLDSVTGNKRMAETFERLGINVQGADGRLRSVIDVSRDLADRIKEMGQGADATGTLMLLLGRAGTETADIFLQGSEAFDRADSQLRRLGGYMSDEAIAASEEYQTAVSNLQTALIGVKSALAEDVIPVLTDLITFFTEEGIPTTSRFVESVKDLPSFFEDLATSLLDAIPGLDGFGDALDRIRGREAALARQRAENQKLAARAAGQEAAGAPEDLVILPDGRVVTESEAAKIKSAAAAPAAAPAGRRGGRSGPAAVVPGSAAERERRERETAAFIGGGMDFGRAGELAGVIEHENAKTMAMVEAERARQEQLDQLRREDLQRQEEIYEQEIALIERTKQEQIGAALASFGAIETLAGIAQQAVEDSYFGQTLAGKRAAKALFVAGKAAAIAQAVVNTALAVSNALANIPAPANAPAAVAAGIAGAAQIATIAATTIQGVADAGLPPGALREAGLNRHTVLAVRQDEMVMDPNGTSEITKMLALQRRQMEAGVMGSANQPTEVIVEMDGRRLTRALGPHLTRSIEDGSDFRQNVRYAGAV
jgi:hypothetical protein